ncbi:MAG: glycosyltransferase family 4 protein [Acidimicrobiia bacterium]
MTDTNQLSVALLTNAPAPYRTPFFNELAKKCDLLVVFDTLRGPGREWEVDEGEFEFRWAVTRALPFYDRLVARGSIERRIPHIPVNVISLLERDQPDVVVSLEFGARTAEAALFCRLRKRPLIVWWEGTPHTERNASALKRALRRTLLRQVTRAWGNGKESARSLTSYGLANSRIDLGMTGVDTTRWRRGVDHERDTTRTALREQLGLRGVVLLFVGRLTALKGVRDLLAALTLLADDRDLPAWSALFVGSGSLTHEVADWARRHPAVHVAMTGFVQPRDLAQYYAAADLFVMPSLIDRWSLVCLEAVAAGLPQVTSSLAGAAVDLVTSSEIGVVVDPRDAISLAGHLGQRIWLGPQRVPEAYRESVVAKWSPSSMAERAISSLRASVYDTKSIV